MNYKAAKRLLDIFGSIIGLILLSPVMVVTSIFIKIVSPGPVFADIPERIGKDSIRFKMYKFRSMIPNAHQYLLSHPKLYEKYKKNSYKLDPDPRMIKGGNLLRKSSIDELPQFINVLKGDMSLVGPRSYYPFELEDQQKVFPHTKENIKQLLKVKPGVTGPWQVGGRSEISFEERVKMDAECANKESILYDILVIIKTPFVVLLGRGAY